MSSEEMPRPSLLLAAFPPELANLEVSTCPGWEISCTGVGAVTAAVTTARLLESLQPRQVVFVGTCGAYDQRLAIGDFIEASEAVAVSLDELEGRGYRPAIEPIRWPATLPSPSNFDFPIHTVAVPPVVTRTVEGAERLASVAGAEHLELTGVFAACQAAGIPCGAFLAVADRVGPNAHEEWRANNARVSIGLMEALKSKGLFTTANE
jgi:purine-nucleoside phosphorylase